MAALGSSQLNESNLHKKTPSHSATTAKGDNYKFAAKGGIAHYEPFSHTAKMFLNVVCWRGIRIFGKGYVCIVYLSN